MVLNKIKILSQGKGIYSSTLTAIELKPNDGKCLSPEDFYINLTKIQPNITSNPRVGRKLSTTSDSKKVGSRNKASAITFHGTKPHIGTVNQNQK